MMSSQDGTGWRRPRLAEAACRTGSGSAARSVRRLARGLVGLAVVDLVGGGPGASPLGAPSAAPRARRPSRRTAAGRSSATRSAPLPSTSQRASSSAGASTRPRGSKVQVAHSRARPVAEVAEPHRPAVVVAAPGVPGHRVGRDLLLGQPGVDELGERRGAAGGRAAGRRRLGLLDDVRTLGQHRRGVPLHPVGRDARGDGDLVDAVPGAHAGLDLAGT